MAYRIKREKGIFIMLDTAMLLEIFGYFGSFLVVFSMLMSSVVKLRVINAIGSVISGTYALLCGAIPLMVMNACLIIINVYNLYKLLKTKQSYDLVEGNAQDVSLKYFVKCHKEDIHTYFPTFDEAAHGEKAYMVYCNGDLAGVLFGEEKTAGVIDVTLDYSTPAYRDCSLGAYLYSKLPEYGVHTLEFSQEETKQHVSYLKKMGFEKIENKYVKKIK